MRVCSAGHEEIVYDGGPRDCPMCLLREHLDKIEAERDRLLAENEKL